MSLQVSLFIDYMNAYHSAREVFSCSPDDQMCGHFWPRKLGEVLCANYRDTYPHHQAIELHDVRVYRGEPRRNLDTPGYDAFQRQKTAWEKTGTQVFSALMQYDSAQIPVGEKEIDVMLAVDFVAGAIEGDFDIGVLFSRDRDLMPALRYVREHLDGRIRADVAGWGRVAQGKYLTPPGQPAIRHLFGRADFDRVSDSTDYRRKSSKFRKANQRKRRGRR